MRTTLCDYCSAIGATKRIVFFSGETETSMRDVCDECVDALQTFNPAKKREPEKQPIVQWSKTGNVTKEKILSLLKDESLTVHEIAMRLNPVGGDLTRTSSIVNSSLWKLKYEGKIDSSMVRPKKYFLRGKDHELAEALKNVKHR